MADYDISKINLKGNDLNFADKEARKAIESLDSTVNDIPEQLTDIKSITTQTLNAVSDTTTRFNSVDSQLATLQKSIVDTNGNVLSSKEDINKQINAVRNSIADLSQSVTDDYASMLSDMTDLSNKLSQVNANVLRGNQQLSDAIAKIPILNTSTKRTDITPLITISNPTCIKSWHQGTIFDDKLFFYEFRGQDSEINTKFSIKGYRDIMIIYSVLQNCDIPAGYVNNNFLHFNHRGTGLTDFKFSVFGYLNKI